jgi:nicotinate-nucleotide--dimethylbenzimidazole phosphoribosyltransferase
VASPSLDLDSLGADVEWPDNEAAADARAAADASLGRVADLAEWLSGVQGRYPPAPFARVRLVVFGQDADPVVEQLAADVAASVRYVNSDVPSDASAAVAAGAAIADDEVESGADLLLVAYPDAGVSAAVAVAVLTNTEPVKVLPRGSAATDPEAWMDRAVAVRDARLRAIEFRAQPDELLATLAKPTFAAAVGFVLRAAVRRTPVLLDGTTATAAALTAYQAQPRAVRWWAVADSTGEPAQTVALTSMGLRPVLDLGLGLHDGTAALLALPVLRSASRLIREAVSDS